MRWRNTNERYGLVAATLHWIIVAGVVGQYFLAEAAEGIEDAPAGTIDAMNVHSSLGVTLLVLATLRLAWRLVDRKPAWPATQPKYELFLARGVHAAFYVLLFAIPLSGWLLASLEGESLRYFGLIDLPSLSARGGESTEELFEEVHEILFNTLVFLGLVHVAAALKHRFFDGSDVLSRMLPARRF